MSRAAISGLIILLLAATFASAASMFDIHSSDEDDFCFGYAICE
jgi:hypothetical protein